MMCNITMPAWRHVLVCCLPLVLGSCGCGEDVAGGGGCGSSSETVIATLYKQDGTPAAGARVRVRSGGYLADTGGTAGGFSYRLGTGGAITLTGLQNGSYGIEVRDDDGSGAFIQAYVDEQEMGDGPYSYSDTLRSLGSVRGWVVAADTGTAYVRMYGIERLDAVELETDSASQWHVEPFVLDSIPQGSYTVVVSQDSLVTYGWVRVTAGQDAEIDTLWLE